MKLKLSDYPVPEFNSKFGFHAYPFQCNDIPGKSYDWHRSYIQSMKDMGASWISFISSPGGSDGYTTGHTGCSELTFEIACDVGLMSMVRTFNAPTPPYFTDAKRKLCDRLLGISKGKPFYLKTNNEIDAEFSSSTGRNMTLNDAKWCCEGIGKSIDEVWELYGGAVIPSFLNVGYGGQGFNFFQIMHDIGMGDRLDRCWIPVHPYNGAWLINWPWSETLLEPILLTREEYESYGDYAWGKGTAALQTLEFVNEARIKAHEQRVKLNTMDEIMGAYAYGFFTYNWALYMLEQLGHTETPLLFPEWGTRVGETVPGLPAIDPKRHMDYTLAMIQEMQAENRILGSGEWFWDAHGTSQNWFDQALISPVWDTKYNENMPEEWKTQIVTPGRLPLADYLESHFILESNKLGCHFQRSDSSWLELAGKCSVNKTMDLNVDWCKALREKMSPESILIGRAFVDYQDRVYTDPNSIIDELIGKYAPAIRYLDAVEFVNELVNNSTTSEQLKLFDSAQVEFANKVWSIWPDKKVVLFNLPTGNWGVANEPNLFSCPLSMGLDYDKVLIGVHGYGWPEFNTSAEWYVLRYRKLMEGWPNHRFILNELGVTHAIVAGQPDVGWRTQTGTDVRQRYIDGLRWVNDELNFDQQMMGGTVYVVGQSYGWDTFESGAELEEAIVDVEVDEPPVEPPEEPGEPPVNPINDAESYGVTIQNYVPKEGELYFKVIKVHHLTSEENNGMHNVFLDVLNLDGTRMYGSHVKGWWGPSESESAIAVIDKPLNEPGTNMTLDSPRQTMNVKVVEYPGDMVLGMNTNHPDEPPVTAWGHNGNSLGHHSYLVEWKLVKAPGTTPPPEPPPTGTTSITVEVSGTLLTIIKDGKIIDYIIHVQTK